MESKLAGESKVHEAQVEAEEEATIAMSRPSIWGDDEDLEETRERGTLPPESDDETMVRMVFEELERPIPLVRRVSKSSPTLSDESFPAVAIAQENPVRSSSPSFHELEARALGSVRPTAASIPAAAPSRGRGAAIALMVGAAAFFGLAGGKWLATHRTSVEAASSIATDAHVATAVIAKDVAPAAEAPKAAAPIVIETTIEAAVARATGIAKPAIAGGEKVVESAAREPTSPKDATSQIETLDEDQPEIQPPFDASAASTSLTSIASSLSSCATEEGAPVGSATVAVTFSSSGRVTSAVVEGAPFAGTKAGGCIAAKLRAAHVAAFSGAPVTVHKTFAIR